MLSQTGWAAPCGDFKVGFDSQTVFLQAARSEAHCRAAKQDKSVQGEGRGHTRDQGALGAAVGGGRGGVGHAALPARVPAVAPLHGLLAVRPACRHATGVPGTRKLGRPCSCRAHRDYIACRQELAVLTSMAALLVCLECLLDCVARVLGRKRKKQCSAVRGGLTSHSRAECGSGRESNSMRERLQRLQ